MASGQHAKIFGMTNPHTLLHCVVVEESLSCAEKLSPIIIIIIIIISHMNKAIHECIRRSNIIYSDVNHYGTSLSCCGKESKRARRMTRHTSLYLCT